MEAGPGLVKTIPPILELASRTTYDKAKFRAVTKCVQDRVSGTSDLSFTNPAMDEKRQVVFPILPPKVVQRFFYLPSMSNPNGLLR